MEKYIMEEFHHISKSITITVAILFVMNCFTPLMRVISAFHLAWLAKLAFGYAIIYGFYMYYKWTIK